MELLRFILLLCIFGGSLFLAGYSIAQKKQLNKKNKEDKNK